jgi:hypothetical protein
LNLVFTHARTRSRSRDVAIDELILLQKRLVDDCRHELHHAVSRVGGAEANRYAELLAGAVDGNLAAVRTLYYRDVEWILGRLQSVGRLESSRG